MAWMPIPTVIEKTGRGEIARSLFDRLLDDRIIFIGTPIDDGIANLVIGQMLYLQKENRTQDINLYINSPGGSVTAGLAIYDVMQFIQPDVATYCVGQAASMGAVLLAAGADGKRFSLPHSRIMIHQPSGGTGGTAADISIQAQEILRLKDTLNRILAHHCKRDVRLIGEESDRDKFMSPDEAKAYGLIDDVITTSKGLASTAEPK